MHVTGQPHLVLFEHFALEQRLHGIDLAGVYLLAESDLAQSRQPWRGHMTARRVLELTSPNAPLPMTLTVLKSSRPIFVRLSRKKL